MAYHKEPIRYGMVGGGKTGGIGKVHRISAEMFDRFKLCAGVFSSNPEISLESALEWGVPPDRNYRSYEEMASRESERLDGIQAVVITTPNHLHSGPIKAFISKGIHVICDKPLTTSLNEAKEIQDVVQQSDRVFMMTYCYTGYPMVREAKARILRGDIGQIKMIKVEYPQGHLATPLEETGQKTFQWRTDPARSGEGGTIADIGSHAYHMLRFVTGLKVKSVSAELSSVVKSRRVDDNAIVNLRLENDAVGLIWASQIAIGHENSLNFKVYGDLGSLEWSHTDPTKLWLYQLDKPKQLITRGSKETTFEAQRVTHVPAGHPEGYYEAFANLYLEVARAIYSIDNEQEIPTEVDYPDIVDGYEGMEFISACIESSRRNCYWVDMQLANLKEL